MSVTVGFSQATTPLLGAAPGTTKPDGTPADGSTDGVGDAGLFAALLAMLLPGAQPTDQTDIDAATGTPDAAASVAPATIVPSDLPAAAATDTPPAPELTDLQKSEQGKALLKDFAAALKAAKAALDEGKPLDPTLEKKLEDTAAAIAAWFAGQPLPPPAPTSTAAQEVLANAGSILPTPSGDLPSGDLPPAAPDTSVPPPAATPDTGADAAAAPADSSPGASPVSNAETAPTVLQAKIVPEALARLGDVLKDFAAQLEKTSPELAKALARLADRLSAGDVSDDVLAQLGLQRTPDSSSAELDQLVASLTTPKPQLQPAAPTVPIAAPTLQLPELAARKPETADQKPDATRPDPLQDLQLEPDVKLEAKADKPDDRPASSESKPVSPAANHAATKPADAPAPATPAADTSPQVAQPVAAATNTTARAIHAAYSAPVQQLNLPQVAFEVARQFEAGNTRFQIRLDPPELGRIDVKLDLDKHGTVNARMFVERPETLDLMLRDQRALQQALQQAGLDTAKTNLEFSLRQNPFAGSGADTGQSGGNGGQPGFGPFGTPAAEEGTELAPQTLYRGSASASGVNLFV